MKPVMFCRNRIGTLRWSHNSMKCAPFSEDSENSTPLLAMMPIGMPWIWAKPQTSVAPYSGLNSWNSLPSTSRAMISRWSNGMRQVGADDAGDFR